MYVVVCGDSTFVAHDNDLLVLEASLGKKVGFDVHSDRNNHFHTALPVIRICIIGVPSRTREVSYQ